MELPETGVPAVEKCREIKGSDRNIVSEKEGEKDGIRYFKKDAA